MAELVEAPLPITPCTHPSDHPLLGRQVAELVRRDPDVKGTSSLRCRRLGPHLHVETRLQVPFGLTVSAAQQVATKAVLHNSRFASRSEMRRDRIPRVVGDDNKQKASVAFCLARSDVGTPAS